MVPVGSSARWKSEPFRATRDGDWLYGRGAGDMKWPWRQISLRSMLFRMPASISQPTFNSNR
uniref:hypothetical protein n=1 Tax=Sinorhizobium chiapasense TaxID=501572 RepID=UPI0038CD38EA